MLNIGTTTIASVIFALKKLTGHWENRMEKSKNQPLLYCQNHIEETRCTYIKMRETNQSIGSYREQFQGKVIFELIFKKLRLSQR